jgi:hypothetical protein
MKKNYAILSIVMLLFASSMTSQVGIGTSAPKGALDVDASNMGFVYPRIALTSTTVETVSNPNGETIVVGTTIYNTASSGSGTTAVHPGIYTWGGTQWIPQFHKRDYVLREQNSNLRTGSNDLTYPVLGNQTIPMDNTSFTPEYHGNYLVIVTVHYGGGTLDDPNYGNDQHVNFISQEGEFDFTFNGTTHSFTMKTYSGNNDDKLFDGGSFNEHTNRKNQAVYSFVESLTEGASYSFSLTFNQTTSEGFVQNGDQFFSNDGRGYITLDDNMKCTVEFKYVGN